jgi:stage V sporulation protein AC
MNKTQYKALSERRAARTPILSSCLAAFLVGGSICLFGQALSELYLVLGADAETAGTLVTVTLIFLSALATGLGIFDTVARVAGAGTLVPVTGFANAVVSPALDASHEGRILGEGAKIFTVAGPVLLYAILGGAVYGLIFWFFGVVL